MHRVYRLAGGVIGLVLLLWVSPSWGQDPPTNDVSDVAHGNTGGGSGALVSTTGSFNTAYGRSALQSDTIGSANAAFGFQALISNTIGSANAAFGNQALSSNTVGSDNAAFGIRA